MSHGTAARRLGLRGPSSAPETAAGGRPRLAVRWRCTVERPAGEAIHALALIRLDPPAPGMTSAGSLVETRRACRYGRPFDVSVDLAEEAWLEAIENALIETIKSDDQAVQRLHRDLDVSIANVLDDPERYERYYRALLSEVEAGRGTRPADGSRAEAAMGQGPHEPGREAAMGQGPREPGREAAEAVAAVHRAFAAPWIGEAQGNVRIEHAVAPTAERPPAGEEAPAAALRPIPFAASIHGVEAGEIRPGMVIAPERNRSRHYKVVGVVEGSEKGTVTVFCRALGPDGEAPADDTPDALFSVASSVRVPLAGERPPATPSGDLFSNPTVFLATAAVVLSLLYLLLGWYMG